MGNIRLVEGNQDVATSYQESCQREVIMNIEYNPVPSSNVMV